MTEETIWTCQKGSQARFLSCPTFEALFEGTRGNGKTDALLMDFLQLVGKGYGPAWRGILFRRTFPELQDIIAKTKKWYHQAIPGAVYNNSGHFWTFPDGEMLMLRQFRVPSDYWNYHGHEYPWIGWEELTNWPVSDGFESMISCCRSSFPDIPKRLRSTTNAFGPGHGWVKARYIDPMKRGTVLIENGMKRVAIHGTIHENKILLKNDTNYLNILKSITDKNKKKAWLDGDWDIVTGGALDGYWYPEQQVIKPFKIPHSWTYGRSFDWGSTKPFSVGWWAISDGTEVDFINHKGETKKRSFPPGSVFRIAELYGWDGKTPNKGNGLLSGDIARQIIKIETEMGIFGKVGYYDAMADSAIFDVKDGESIALTMERVGVSWSPSNKSPGSRVLGLDKIRSMMKQSTKDNPEEPGVWIFENCRQSIRTLPAVQMSEKKPEDVDSDGEDHIYDEWRYFLLRPKYTINTGQAGGV